MNDYDQLSPMPAPSMQKANQPREPKKRPILKPESPWATRIRELLAMHDDGVHYVPYLPVPKKRFRSKLVEGLLDLRGNPPGEPEAPSKLPPLGGDE